jgi:hypothetical protein
VYVLLSTYTALRLSQICGGLCQTRKTPTLDGRKIAHSQFHFVHFVKLLDEGSDCEVKERLRDLDNYVPRTTALLCHFSNL